MIYPGNSYFVFRSAVVSKNVFLYNLPVKNILINIPDHRVGSYVVRPSAVIKASNPIDRVLRSGNPRDHLRRKAALRVCPLNNFTGSQEDPNIVIAAYGTQVTLHR